MSDPVAGTDDRVGVYKTILREVIERRPSGMRQRLAEALGTTRSFVSQITNPAYATPIPAAYVATIVEVCHFSEAERTRFLSAYRRAHPRRGAAALRPRPQDRTITLVVPDYGTDALNGAFDEMLAEAVERMRRLVDLKTR